MFCVQGEKNRCDKQRNNCDKEAFYCLLFILLFIISTFKKIVKTAAPVSELQ